MVPYSTTKTLEVNTPSIILGYTDRDEYLSENILTMCAIYHTFNSLVKEKPLNKKKVFNSYSKESILNKNIFLT